METACPDSAQKPSRWRRKSPKLRPSRATKQQVLTRENLDHRTRALKAFDAIARSIATDLGGEDRLSTVQRHLVEAFAGVAINVSHLNAQILIGEKVDICAHSQAVSTMVRVASRIGLGRVAKELPSLAEYLASLPKHEPQVEARADEVAP